ncbi:luciferin 4-monooxygenase-like [Contarinia nasturtii]|uniref:luciferin 4-monooxygenase-like n=1 Tax=Contarinia nasturtii TaxID=265458 RepID=UPI0012D3EA05|nr:luciferin 4-monooxygenase-like [Contarinia nasturtii]
MNNILYGGYEGSEEDVCEGAKSLGEALLNKLRAAGQRIVLIDGITGEEISAHKLLSKAVCLARYLQENVGIKSGDIISICSENRIEFAITIHATLFLGATIAALNHGYVEYEMTHAINLSKPRLIFASSTNFKKIATVSQKLTFVEQIIFYGSDNCTKGHPNAISFNQITTCHLTDSQLDTFKCEPQNVKENVALIMCSSGTTGLPKGVQLTQFNLFIANVQFHERLRSQEIPTTREEIVLGNLPIFHAYGMSTYIVRFLGRRTHIVKTILMSRFNEAEFLVIIQKYKVTTTYLVPPIMVLLAKSALVTKYDLSSWHTAICGAAPLGKETETEVKQRIGLKIVRQGYGMTEGTFAYCVQDDERHTNGSVGVLLKGLFGRVVDLNTGKSLGPRQEGEIHFKGPNIMKGYIGNKKATDETIEADGWLHTGDIGYYDENGEWYVVDRLKELIKYKAFQVPPAEIEALLLTHPGIRDAAVIGVPNELAGEMAFAFVVKQTNADINEKDVINYVAERLSNPKRLHGGVKFIDEIPKNPSGKILRRVLRDMIKTHKSKL